MTGGDIPAGDKGDNDYTSRTGQKQAPIPVQSDNDTVEDPIDPATADSDETLGMHSPNDSIASESRLIFTAKDEASAIDSNNIIDSRTRGAAKSSGTYREPGDEEGLPADDGTSNVSYDKIGNLGAPTSN